MHTLKKERIVAISILVAVLVLLLFIIPTYVETAGQYEITGLSPAFFPNIAVIFIGVLAAIFLLLTFIKRWAHLFNSEEMDWLSPLEELNAIISGFIIVAYIGALKFVGFFIATPPVILGLFYLQGERKIIKPIAITIVVTVGVYLIFHYLLNVQFPEGYLFK